MQRDRFRRFALPPVVTVASVTGTVEPRAITQFIFFATISLCWSFSDEIIACRHGRAKNSGKPTSQPEVFGGCFTLPAFPMERSLSLSLSFCLAGFCLLSPSETQSLWHEWVQSFNHGMALIRWRVGLIHANENMWPCRKYIWRSGKCQAWFGPSMSVNLACFWCIFRGCLELGLLCNRQGKGNYQAQRFTSFDGKKQEPPTLFCKRLSFIGGARDRLLKSTAFPNQKSSLQKTRRGQPRKRSSLWRKGGIQ